MKRERLWQWAWCLVLCFVLLTLPILGCAKTPPTAPSPPTEPTPVEQNPVVEYASERDLFQPIIDKLQPLGYDGMSQHEKALVDYLYGVSQAEVVSPEVLELAPSSYRDEVTQSLQIKVVDAVLSDSEVSREEADALTYLSTFPWKAQRDLIEFGFDDTLVNYLVLNSSLEDQQFAEGAVTNRLCLEDHLLVNEEIQFLRNHSQKNLEKLLEIYEFELHSYPQIGPVLLNEIQRSPGYEKDLATLEGLEDVAYMLKHATNPEVKEAFELMLRYGNLYEEKNVEIAKGQQVAKNVKIDGRKNDWGDLKPACIDVKGDDIEEVVGTDILGVYATMDENHLYVMFDMGDRPNTTVAYVFAIDVDGDEDWDYTTGFRVNRAWFYDVREYKNREWPEKAETLAAEIAFDEVAEFRIPLSKIGNPQTIVIYPWVSDYPRFFDEAGPGIVSRKPLMPDWNAQLQVLYRLAQQNEFGRSDTLAQAIAIDNGIWVTLGNGEVREAAHKTANDLLNFFRETNEIQKANRFHLLEDYPLEAKISLGWIQGNSLIASHGGFHKYHPVYYGLNKKLDLKFLKWHTPEIDALREMRKLAYGNNWWSKDSGKTVGNLEFHFYFNLGRYGYGSTHWKYSGDPPYEAMIIVDGEEVENRLIGNVDHLFRDYLDDGIVYGVCTDEQLLVDTWCKSVGVASNGLMRVYTRGKPGHNFTMYYDPMTISWKAYEKQLNIWIPEVSMQDKVDYYLLVVPANFEYYLRQTGKDLSYGHVNLLRNISGSEAKERILEGIPTSLIKGLLFSS